MAYRTYSTANGWIVDQNGKGDFTSIGAAITAFNAAVTAGSLTNIDVFLHPNTYTENFTIPAGMNITCFTGDLSNPNVIISGKVTMSTAGTAIISNIQLQTNSDFAIVVSGSVTSVLILNSCKVICKNNTGISFTSSNANSNISLVNCVTDLLILGIALFTKTSIGGLSFNNNTFANSGLSITASTSSAGPIVIIGGGGSAVFSMTSTGQISIANSIFANGGLNTTVLTTAGTGLHNMYNTYLSSGTASCMSIGTGTAIGVSFVTADSSNTNPITGAGTIVYDCVGMNSSGTMLNVTTQTKNRIFTGGVSFNGGVTALSAIPVPVTQGGTALSGTTANQILYSSATNTIAGLATANGGVLDTTSSGVPQIDTTNFSVLTTGVQVKGNNTNTSPPAGFIGEHIESSVVSGSAVSLPNGTVTPITSIVLTPGIWDISALVAFSGTITGTRFQGGISIISNSLTGGIFGNSLVATPTAPSVGADNILSVPSNRQLVSTNTTFYLIAIGIYTVGTLTGYGRISGTRVG